MASVIPLCSDMLSLLLFVDECWKPEDVEIIPLVRVCLH